MGLLSFIKEAGEKLFGGNAHAATNDAAKVSEANATASKAIVDYIHAMKLDAQDLAVQFDAASGEVTVAGQAADQATREKIVLCCGNVSGVSKVTDQMTVAVPTDESKYYTVVKGDTLSKIAKEFYGNANAYNAIFEANRPMLSHPDKIYPGQTLRIPPKA